MQIIFSTLDLENDPLIDEYHETKEDMDNEALEKFYIIDILEEEYMKDSDYAN